MSSSKTSPLTRIFHKQQKYFKQNKKVANVLTSFADDDYKRIAQLIKVWLEKDAIASEKRRLKK